MRKILSKSSLQAEKYIICKNLCNICKKPLPYLDDECSICSYKYSITNTVYKYLYEKKILNLKLLLLLKIF